MANDVEKPWQESEAARIGANVRAARLEAGLKVQEVADRCTELGVKMLRTTLVNLESGTRKNVTVAELAALGHAIGVSPLLLLYPLHSTDPVEYLPHVRVTPWQAWERFTHPLVVGLGRDTRLLVPGTPAADSEVMGNLMHLERNGAVWRYHLEALSNTSLPTKTREISREEMDFLAGEAMTTVDDLDARGIPLDGLDAEWIAAIRLAMQRTESMEGGQDDDAASPA